MKNLFYERWKWLFSFYRFFFSLSGGVVAAISLKHWWISLPAAAVIRYVWYKIEQVLKNRATDRLFDQHAAEFKQLTGPYGIRLINKAEQDKVVKNSLAEVFTPDIKKLKDTVEQLEVMDTLFKAGMHPDGDAYQLHDLKLKYAKYRLKEL